MEHCAQVIGVDGGRSAVSSSWLKYNREMEIDGGLHHHFQFRIEKKANRRKKNEKKNL